MEVGIVLLICGVELFNLVFFENLFQELLGFDNIFNVFVFGLSLISVFFAVSYAVGNLQKFFSYFSHSKVFAFVNLST